jgi:phage terminase large subunit
MHELFPIKASAFLKFPEQAKRDLVVSGVIPVNDKLFGIWNLDYDIALLYGGRGGGKSEAKCDILLKECLTEEYFKCYYGRKVYDTVRGSCFATLVYCIKKNKLDHLFKYSESESSNMVITCIENGNKFIPFGSDKADKLKSIKDPTHIWCEEFDQFEFNDFKELYPTLRTIRGANRFSATFNTHGVYPSHWLLKIFFPDLYEGNDKDDVQNIDLLKGKRVKKVFVNFTDNYFIDQADYRNNLWLSSAGNITIFEGIANGAWGVMLNDSPYAFAFDRRKHVSDPARGVPHPVLNRAYPVIISFDFNRNPMSALVSQLIDNHLYILEAIKLANSGVDAICEHILTYYPACVFQVTGDYNGNNESSLFAEQVTHYRLIKQHLNLAQGQLKVLPNPEQKKNSTHINNCLAHFPITIHAINARPLIFDLENVKRRADGTILKADRDKPEQQADIFDNFRYTLNAFLDWFDPITYYRQHGKMPGEENVIPLPQAPVINQFTRSEIESGNPIVCSKEDYQATIRNELLNEAGKWLDAGDSTRAQIALMEVKRLDALFK